MHEVGPVLYLLRAAQGAAFVLTFNTAATLATDLAPPQQLSQALGLFGVAMLCTNAIAPSIIEPLVIGYGWSLGFAMAAASSGVAALLASRLHEPVADRRPRHPTAAPLLSRRAISVLAAVTLTGLGFGAMITFTQPFALSLGEETVSALFVGYTLSAIAVRVGLGSLADRVGRQRVAFASMLVYGLVVLAGAGLRDFGLFPLGLGLGCAHGLLYPALNALVVEGVPPHQRGIVMTAYNGCFNLGFALSVVGFGPIADRFGYPAVFLAAGVGTLAGLLPVFSARAAPRRALVKPG